MNKNSKEFLPDLALLEQKAAFGLHKITPAGQKKWLVFRGDVPLAEHIVD